MSTHCSILFITRSSSVITALSTSAPVAALVSKYGILWATATKKKNVASARPQPPERVRGHDVTAVTPIMGGRLCLFALKENAGVRGEETVDWLLNKGTPARELRGSHSSPSNTQRSSQSVTILRRRRASASPGGSANLGYLVRSLVAHTCE